MPYACPTCTVCKSDGDTYASVLVLGAGQLASTLDDIKRVSRSSSVANISSYCLQCKGITPCFNTVVCMPENLMEWKRKHAFFTSCEAFINEWPKKKRFKRVRKVTSEQDVISPTDTPEDP
jgi:hypothetical protein